MLARLLEPVVTWLGELGALANASSSVPHTGGSRECLSEFRVSFVSPQSHEICSSLSFAPRAPSSSNAVTSDLRRDHGQRPLRAGLLERDPLLPGFELAPQSCSPSSHHWTSTGAPSKQSPNVPALSSWFIPVVLEVSRELSADNSSIRVCSKADVVVESLSSKLE